MLIFVLDRICKLCKATFTTKATYRRHCLQASCQTSNGSKSRNRKTCRKCDQVFENFSQHRQHLPTCSKKAEAESRSRSSATKTKTSQSSKSKVAVFDCTVSGCGKVLSSKARLQGHLETHIKPSSDRKNAQCEQCGRKYSKHQLSQHMREQHGIGTPMQKVVCKLQWYRKEFKYPTQLRRHEKSHATNPT